MTTMMPKKLYVGILFINSKGDVLLIHRDDRPEIKNPGMWGIPGGLLEGKETPEEAIKREVMEEISYNLENFKLFFKEKDKDGERYMFISKINKKLTELRLGEGQDFKFFKIEDALKMEKLGPYTRKYLEIYHSN